MARPSILQSLGILIATPAVLLGATEAPEDPPFETLLEAQPIVVHVADPELVRTTEKKFAAVEGDVDPTPAYTETYQHYRVRVIEALKGELPPAFEVRVVAGRSKWVSEEKSEGGFLLVLAPDLGGPEGNGGSTTFLVAHHAAYPVSDGSFTAPSAEGERSWTLAEVRDALAGQAKQKRAHREASPEPAEAAAVPVVAGEDEPRDEPEPPEATATRDQGPRSAEELADAKPREATGPTTPPEEPQLDGPSKTWIWWVVLALVVIFLVLILARRRG